MHATSSVTCNLKRTYALWICTRNEGLSCEFLMLLDFTALTDLYSYCRYMRIPLFFSLCSKVHDRRLPKKKKARMKAMMMKMMMKKTSQSQNVSPLLGREDKVYVGVTSCSSSCCNPFSMKESNFLKSFLLWVFTFSLILVALCYCCSCWSIVNYF